jgi:aryl-alcohol dehydrogenase-like predicted oxidoreductase
MPVHSPVSRRKLLKAGLLSAAATLAPPTLLARTELLTRPVPSTGVRLPVVGIGTNRFRTGDPAWNARLRETLTTFARIGGKAVDTAPSYGDSERAIGAILGETGLRDRFFLATKVDRDSIDEARQRLDPSL